MKAIDLYGHLEKDFICEGLSDDWLPYIAGTEDYLSANFIERSMGLVCDFTEEINTIYSAVFPSEKVMKEILDTGATDAMLFVHHPAAWDISREIALYPMDTALLDQFRERRISIYNLHVPLDNYSEYSTSKTLADALDIQIEKPFAMYFGALCGVMGRTACQTVEELNDVFSQAVGHPTALYQYGNHEIKDGRVAVAAGGGNDRGVVTEMLEDDIRVLITGVSVRNHISSSVHAYEQEQGVNVLGGTHYSTEKFACIKMCDYFNRLGLSAVFIEGEPDLGGM